MARLIDADALPKYTGYALSADEVAKAVENAPTIDAVEVVRCKDCKYYEKLGCTFWGGEYSVAMVTDDDYCSWGERKPVYGVKHGHWVIERDETVMHCNSCGWAYEYYGGLEEEWDYCPHCGAKMDEVEKDEQE